jgi:hypothetical protein
MWLDRKGNVVGKAADSPTHNGERILPDFVQLRRKYDG